MERKLFFVKTCFYVGVVADLLVTIPLVFPKIAKSMFGLTDFQATNEYLYVSRIGASLMLGWTLLLLWASFKPLARKGVLLLTLFPVIFGLVISSILAVTSGSIEAKYMIPLWVFYSLIIPAYASAYSLAGKIESKKMCPPGDAR
jgi:hypothetical protein